VKILAHRGWWLEPSEKNTEAAFRRAFEAGFGVETDTRDLNGVLKIAHDMPVGDQVMDLEYFLELHKSHADAGTIALNIKADGLQKVLHALTDQVGVSDLFCFDMAVPDALGYFAHSFVTYTRHSELEPVPPYYDRAHGVWLDAFYSDWITPDVIHKHLDAGKKVALVSPELHGRDYEAAWRMWEEFKGDDIAICTDVPHLAQQKWNQA
jgi:glycerophosphoryl diester phosphodiesterase